MVEGFGGSGSGVRLREMGAEGEFFRCFRLRVAWGAQTGRC